MNPSDVPLMRFDFRRGAHRGSSLMLYPGSVVHRGEAQFETMPLAAVASVRVAFERDAAKLNWGGALVVVALLLFALAQPLAGLAAAAAQEVASAQAGGAGGVPGAVQASFRFLGALARALPFVGTLVAAGAIGLLVLGWLGRTTLTLVRGAAEREFSAFGRDPTLFDFAEAVGERLRAIRR